MSGQNMDYSDVRIHALESELARVKAELEAMKALAIHHDARAIRFGKEADLWKQKAERYEAALKTIALEPLGHSEATHKEVLAMAEQIAKEALKGGGDAH